MYNLVIQMEKISKIYPNGELLSIHEHNTESHPGYQMIHYSSYILDSTNHQIPGRYVFLDESYILCGLQLHNNLHKEWLHFSCLTKILAYKLCPGLLFFLDKLNTNKLPHLLDVLVLVDSLNPQLHFYRSSN